MEYKGCPILIRRLGCHIEFLVTFKNKFYSEYISLIPDWWKALMDDPFTEKNIQDTSMILVGMAKGLINKLKR